MDDKIIVTNGAALKAKYDGAGLARIGQAVDALVKADAKRGIKSRLVFLDRAASMRRYGRVVTDPSDPKQNKQAIDAIFRTANPEYLMILGAVDVVPHQDIKNPAFDPPDDPDPTADGDLPYACDAPYSRDIATFKGPSRVVGRLPDLHGAKGNPAYLLRLLTTAAGYRSRKPTDYAAYFGLSTFSWRKSTAESLFNAFGNDAALNLAPPKGPTFSAKALAPLAHFINCHGGQADPAFYGEKGRSQPESLTSDGIARKIRPGTVAAVECCYGAELYDSVTLSIAMPICQRYLNRGAYGFFGSSTIAYGPEEGNGAADLITQYFLLALLDGASLGRAALTARQRFVEQVGELDPMDLKTLGQFNLLGDPSIHPVVIASPTAVPRGVDVAKSQRDERKQRRAKLRAVGELLERTKPTASKKARKVRKSPAVRKALANIARKAGIGSTKEFTAYDVKMPPGVRRRGTKGAPVATRYYVAVYRPDVDEYSVAAVAKEVAGRITGYRIYLEK